MRLSDTLQFCFAMSFCVGISAVAAQTPQANPDANRVWSLLNSSQSHVSWDRSSMLTADFDHDGKDDYAFRGTRDETFVVAIIRGSSDKKSWFFRFSVKSPSHKITEICSIDASIKTRSPVLLGSEKRMWHIPAQSKAIVVDDKCDPVNITWDQEKRNFELLRVHVSM